MPAPKTPNTTKAARARRRIGQETMAAKLRAAGWKVTPPPECATCQGSLAWAEDQYICQDCDDEWTYETIHGVELGEA